MSTPTDISAKTTHDLWIEARQFSIEVTRPTPTSILLTITRPYALEVTDGAVVLLSDKPISASNYPRDGEPYAADPNPDWLNPIQRIGDAQVVGAYHTALSKPFPETEQVTADAVTTNMVSAFKTFTITVNNTNPNTIYYASVHASSNIMQYYPIGVQSYPLVGAITERGTSSYTGNIPSFPSAPTAPSPGMVYYDQVLNLVQYFDANTGTWIPTLSESIMSGPYNPGTLGQVYMFGSSLRIFDGVKWVPLTSDNLVLRSAVGDPWVKLHTFSSRVDRPSVFQAGTMYYDYTLERLYYYNGADWVTPNATNALLDRGGDQVPAFIRPITLEPEELRNPYIGQLFYNTTTKDLNAWNGVSWNKVNTDQEGSPSTDKIGIGNDGSYDERIQLIKVLNAQMGWPQLCVELQEEQFNIAIDNAIQNYRQLSSGAYKRGFILFRLIAGQQKYYLNSAVDKTDHIVDIHKIYRVSPYGFGGAGPNDVWAQAFAQQYYEFAAGQGDILTTHLLSSYGEEISRVFAGELMFQWDEPSHELLILRGVHASEIVVIEAMLERSEQELLTDRWCQQYIQGWAMAELKMTLGLIRSKFASGTPGPGGSITLNGELLIAEARQDMTELKEELLNYEYGGPVGMGNCSFLIG